MSDSEGNPPNENNNNNNNNSAHCKTIFKQTFKFAKDVPEQRISPEGFLIRDCGCVMRFLPSLDNKLNKGKPQPAAKNQHSKNNSRTQNRASQTQSSSAANMSNCSAARRNETKTADLEEFKCKTSYIQHTSLYQSTFWMEPRVVPVKYTTEVNFNLECPTKKFTETIDLQMKLVPCPYIQQIGITKRFKTSIETRIQSEYTVPLETTI